MAHRMRRWASALLLACCSLLPHGCTCRERGHHAGEGGERPTPLGGARASKVDTRPPPALDARAALDASRAALDARPAGRQARPAEPVVRTRRVWRCDADGSAARPRIASVAATRRGLIVRWQISYTCGLTPRPRVAFDSGARTLRIAARYRGRAMPCGRWTCELHETRVDGLAAGTYRVVGRRSREVVIPPAKGRRQRVARRPRCCAAAPREPARPPEFPPPAKGKPRSPPKAPGGF